MTFFKRVLLLLALFTVSELIVAPIFINGSTGFVRTSGAHGSTIVDQSKYSISEYDYVMRDVALELDLDWKLLAAIGYHESRFNNNLTSRVGALGLMQVMPRVAKSFGVTPQQALEPEVNIRVAGKLLKKIERSLTISHLSEQQKMPIILACYNAGIGHVLDARRLAAKHGNNLNSWDVLSLFLKIKGTPEYVNDEAVRCGKFAGGQTVAFVNNVMERYDVYSKRAF